MDLEQRLRASMVAPKPGPMFTARVLARIARGAARRRSRFILMGTVLVVGAAAAMLAWRMSGMQSPPLEVAAMPVVSDPVPVAADPVVLAEPETTVSVAAESPSEPVTNVESPRYSVLVVFKQESQDQSKRVPAEAFHAALLEELRKVPGLALQLPGEPAGGDQADYVLTITNLANFVPLSASLRTSNTPPIVGTYNYDEVAWVERSVDSPHMDGANGHTVALLPEGAAVPQVCSTPSGRNEPVCKTPALLAASEVRDLRLQIFPHDADDAYYLRLPELLESGRQNAAGDVTLMDLLSGLIRDGGSRLDAGTVLALAMNLAGRPASTRASAWKTLSLARHPALVAPLVESLRRDADRQVRLAALANLAANYSTDPVVRRAFEDIGRADADLVVRATVRVALHGPSQWRTDVLAALKDAGMPYEARLAPLLVSTSTGSRKQDAEVALIRQHLLQEQQVLNPLLALIREHLRDADHVQANGDVLGLLNNVDDPAVFDLFLEIAREKSWPSGITVQVRNWAANHKNDPRVPASLPQFAPNFPADLQQRMREYVEKTGHLPSFGEGSGSLPLPQ